MFLNDVGFCRKNIFSIFWGARSYFFATRSRSGPERKDAQVATRSPKWKNFWQRPELYQQPGLLHEALKHDLCLSILSTHDCLDIACWLWFAGFGNLPVRCIESIMPSITQHLRSSNRECRNGGAGNKGTTRRWSGNSKRGRTTELTNSKQRAQILPPILRTDPTETPGRVRRNMSDNKPIEQSSSNVHLGPPTTPEVATSPTRSKLFCVYTLIT
jgi:hypothetical protein